MKYTIEMTHKLLKEKRYTEKDLIDKCNNVIQRLEKRRKIEPREPYTRKVNPMQVIDAVYHVQSNMPWKLIILQKIDNDGIDNLRFCYYIISFKRLKEKGKLQMMYGQFGLFIPLEDYEILMKKAKELVSTFEDPVDIIVREVEYVKN